MASIDEPQKGLLKRGRVRFRGWLAVLSIDVEPEFFINGMRVDAVAYEARPDVASSYPQFLVRGWSFDYELTGSKRNRRGVLELEIVQHRSTLARGSFRIDPAALEVRPPLVLFLHMPKCAGTSIRKQLEGHPEAIRLNTLYSDNLTAKDIEHFAEQNAEKSDIYFGHFWYGIHRYIPRPSRYVTVLRNPLTVITSVYFFRKYTVQDPSFVACETIYDALDRHPDYFGNIMTRYLAGIPAGVPVDERAVEFACRKLDSRFDYVGFSESIVETCADLSRYFGVLLEPVVHNETPPSQERAMLDSARFRETARHCCRHDFAVYSHALQHRSCLADDPQPA